MVGAERKRKAFKKLICCVVASINSPIFKEKKLLELAGARNSIVAHILPVLAAWLNKCVWNFS